MNKVVLKEDLSKVATSNNYNDLDNKPLIPSKTSELNNDKGFVDNATLGDIANLNVTLKALLTNAGLSVNFLNAINQAFLYGNNVKHDTVAALIAKGVTNVTVDSSWTDVINAISTIVGSGGSGTSGTLQQITKLNIAAGDVKTVNLGRIVENLKLATSVLLFVPGATGVVEHECSFDNTDSSNFNYDSQYIIFDGKMHPINQVSKPWTDLGAVGTLESYEVEIDESLHKSVDSIIDGDTALTLGVVPPDQLITGKSDIDLAGIDKLKAISESSAGMRFALSFDSGITYYVWNGTAWVTVDITNSADVKAKFMTKTTLDNLTNAQFETIRNGSTKLRIAYLSEQVLSSDSCYTDQLDITVDMKGYDAIAPQANWTYRLLDDKQTIEYTFTVAGTYTINYI